MEKKKIKSYRTVEDFKRRYDEEHKKLYSSVISDFKRDDNFIYYRNYDNKTYRVKIEDVVFVQNVKRHLFNYVNSLEKGNIIKHSRFFKD